MSEAAMYQSIRRYWKRMYQHAQRVQQKSMQIALTKRYPMVRLIGLSTVPDWKAKSLVDYWPADDITVRLARSKAEQYQRFASDYARLLNSFKLPVVKGVC